MDEFVNFMQKYNFRLVTIYNHEYFKSENCTNSTVHFDTFNLPIGKSCSGCAYCLFTLTNIISTFRFHLISNLNWPTSKLRKYFTENNMFKIDIYTIKFLCVNTSMFPKLLEKPDYFDSMIKTH